MSKITREYDKELRVFTDAMRYKLHINRQRGKWEGADLAEVITMMRNAVDNFELEVRGESPNQTAVLVSAADVANLAMIAADVSHSLILNGEVSQTNIFESGRV